MNNPKAIYERPLEEMIGKLLEMGIKDFSVLDAMRRVPRHIFIDEALRSRAYENMSLPIGYKQTISQPYIVAKMTELLVRNSAKQNEKFEKILEIGSGCGYQSAVLSYFADEVHSVERIKQLVSKARENLSDLRIHNVLIKNRDGFEGWDEEIKYDGILCAAAPPEIPKSLLAFLKVGCCARWHFKMSIRLRFLLAGFCIGLAELLPGISGATVALMFGIYKKLIECISKLKDLDLLVPLLLGMAVSVFGFSKLINFLFLNYTNLFEFFIGILMIFYGAYLFLSNIQKSKRKELFFFSLLFVISVAIGVAIGNLSGLDASVGTFPLVIYGFIAFSFLLIPGISGSAFLLAIGIYPLIIGSVADLNLLVLLPFTTGMLFSLITMPKCIYFYKIDLILWKFIFR